MSKVVVKNTGGGIGFGGLLTLLFIGLKLGGVIDWSWVWVLSPLWIPLAAVFGILLVVGVFISLGFGIAAIISAFKRKR